MRFMPLPAISNALPSGVCTMFRTTLPPDGMTTSRRSLSPRPGSA